MMVPQDGPAAARAVAGPWQREVESRRPEAADLGGRERRLDPQHVTALPRLERPTGERERKAEHGAAVNRSRRLELVHGTECEAAAQRRIDAGNPQRQGMRPAVSELASRAGDGGDLALERAQSLHRGGHGNFPFMLCSY